MNETVTRWIRANAQVVTPPASGALLPGPLSLEATVRDAAVVAMGASSRQCRELSGVAYRILRSLVEEHGFRSLALEGDDAVRTGLAAYAETGSGDPRALLAQARVFWQTEEVLEVVRWMRAHNEEHPDDPVRFARVPDVPHTGQPADGLAGIEQTMAADTMWWHEQTGDRIVYWGGIAHTVKGDPRTLSPSATTTTHRNAGGHLRERLGAGYVSIGLMFDHGSVPYPVPAPPAGFAEAALGGSGLGAYFLDLRGESPDEVRAWLDAPAKTRMIGPAYDIDADADHHLSGASLAEWFDAVVHVQEVTPVTMLSGNGTEG